MQTTQCYEQSMVGIIAYRSISLRKHVVSHAMQITLFDPKNHYNQIQNILKNPENFTPGPLPESPHIIDTPRRDIVFQIMQQVWIHVAKSKLGSKFLLHCWEVSRRGYPTEKSEKMKKGCTRLVLGEAFSVAH